MEQRWRARVGAAGAALVLLGFGTSCEPTGSNRTTLLAGNFRTYDAWPIDLDGDGDQDLLVNSHGEARGSGLFLNDGTGRLTDHGGVFKDYPGQGDQWHDRHDCDVADVDRNGRLDIFCTNGRDEDTPKPFPWDANELLLQQPDKTFVNVADTWGVLEPWTRGRDVAFVNADGDGYPDLISTSDRRSDGHPSENTLYLNDRGTRFVPTGSAGLPRFGPVRCLEKADWNLDGFTDVALCPLHGGVQLYQASGSAGFVDVTTTRGGGPTGTATWDVAFADVNRDGAPDLVRANTTSVSIRLWDTVSKRFTDGPVIAQPDARDLALGRYDDDHHLDLYVVNRGCPGCAPSNLPDRIYRGNGDGTFRLAEVLDAAGVGDFVATWDPTGTERVRWVVGHGYGPVYGPLEAIASRRS